MYNGASTSVNESRCVFHAAIRLNRGYKTELVIFSCLDITLRKTCYCVNAQFEVFLLMTALDVICKYIFIYPDFATSRPITLSERS